MQTPQEIEQLLTDKIYRSLLVSPNDTLLGFLDVDDDTQLSVLEILRGRSSLETVNSYLRRYPALSCYGLAVAVSVGLEEDGVGSGAVYGAWERTIRFFPNPNEREPLAKEFTCELERLGLPVGTISPDKPLHWKGGCFLFHGGILPHYVRPLQIALDSVQKQTPLPDIDDDERLCEFASLLAERVHPGQIRLRKTLQSSVGPLLVRRLILWLNTQDDSLFPAHIRPLLEEQKQASVLLRSPYVQFDETEGQMLLVLPAQTSRVADTETRWTVNGRSYRATQEQPPLPLEDLDIQSDTFEVVLSRLKDGRPNYSYTLIAGILPERGFRVFDAATGKERKQNDSASATIELPPGQSYLIALSDEATIISDHSEIELDSIRYLHEEITPRSEPIQIEQNGTVWKLAPKVRPGIYLSSSDGSRFRISRLDNDKQVMVHYGTTPNLICVVLPEKEGATRIHFSTVLPGDYGEIRELPYGQRESANHLFDASGLLSSWMELLPNAVHSIKVVYECGNQRMTEQFLYWKGLETITSYGDLICTELPQNLVSNAGLERNGNKLERPHGRRTRAILGFSGVGFENEEKWILPSDQVNITLALPDESSVGIDEGTTVEILPDDKRTLQIRSGGLMPTALYCGKRFLCEVSPEKRPLSRYLSTLTAEFGRSGCLTARPLNEVTGNQPRLVLRWQTPQMAEECRLEDDADPKMVIWLVRKVSITGIAGLRLRLLDFVSKLEGRVVESILPLRIPERIDSNAETSLGIGFSCSVRRKEEHVQVRISFDRSELQGVVWIVDLECQLSDSEVWQPVMVPEKHGRIASIRFPLIGGTPDADKAHLPETSMFWGKPYEDLAPESYALRLKGAGLNRWLECVQWLIDWKYPTPVWKQNGSRLHSLYQRLSTICFFKGDAERSMWWGHAVKELQKHALERQPIVMPCLLMASSLKMAATKVAGMHLAGWEVDGLIGRCFREVDAFETGNRESDLDYVHGVFQNNRLPTEFLAFFSGWARLRLGRPEKLGKFDYIGWSNWLAAECQSLEFSAAHESETLLSPAHFVACVAKARKRVEVLQSVADMEHGHWLSAPIAQLRISGDQAASTASRILGEKLGCAPDGILVHPLERLDHGIGNVTLLELIQSIIMASGLLAVGFRAKSKELITTESLILHLHSLIPTVERNPDLDKALFNQVSLVLGTAPELFSFYFLLFTLTLPSSHEPRD